MTKIVNALNVKISPRDLKSKDTRNLLNIVMQQWLPLSTATFQAVVDVIPSPSDAQRLRLPFMLHPQEAAAASEPLQARNVIEEGLYACAQGKDIAVVAYVSKMFAVMRSDLPEFKPKELTAEEMRQKGREERERRAALASRLDANGLSSNGIPMDGIEGLTTTMDTLHVDEAQSSGQNQKEAGVDGKSPAAESSEVLLGFSRIFSGTLRRDTRLIATLPKYDAELPPTHPRNTKYVLKVHVKDLYMMMGRELVAVEEVPAGHVCAIGGLDGVVPRNATLWAPNSAGLSEGQEPSEDLINLAGVSMQVSYPVFRVDNQKLTAQAAPIVRVALEPENPSMV